MRLKHLGVRIKGLKALEFYPHNFTLAVQCRKHQQEERVRLIKLPGPERQN